MDDPAGVGGVQAIRDLDSPIQKHVQWHARVFQAMLERFPIEQFHGEKRAPVALADIVDRADVGVIDGGGRTGFAFEACHVGAVLSQILRNEFQGHIASQARIAGFPDFPHAAAAQQFQNLEVACAARRMARSHRIEDYPVAAGGNAEAQRVGLARVQVVALKPCTKPADLDPHHGMNARVERNAAVPHFSRDGELFQAVGLALQGGLNQKLQQPAVPLALLKGGAGQQGGQLRANGVRIGGGFVHGRDRLFILQQNPDDCKPRAASWK